MVFIQRNKSGELIVLSALFTLIMLSVVVYWPALSGSFLLDDLLHFTHLRDAGAVVDSRSFLDWIFKETNTPGRFLGYMSFLIDDHAWPTDPGKFKYTNLMIHLLNGVLVFALARVFLSLGKFQVNPDFAALTVAALWILHPLQISTVMYVIQRLTLLSSSFVLIGLVLYLYGRASLETKPKNSLILMSVGIGGAGIISLCIKEIGVNVLIYALVLEAVLVARGLNSGFLVFKIWKSIFLILPLVIIAIYFVLGPTNLLEGYNQRDFTLEERLMTQSRVLFDYLGSIVFPRLSELTLYHDDYLISRSLLDPFSTLVSSACLMLAIIIGVVYLKKFPLIFFSVFWFLGGHILESSFIPLEIYFEHRNYVPMLGIQLVLVIFAFYLAKRAPWIVNGTLVLMVMLLVFLSYSNAKVWGNHNLLANIWIKEHPTSTRAIYEMVNVSIRSGRSEDAIKYLRSISELYPYRLSAYLFEELYFHCRGYGDSQVTDELILKAKITRLDKGIFSSVRLLGDKVLRGRCESLSAEKYISLVQSLISNKHYQGYKKGLSFLYEANARMYTKLGDLDQTMKHMDLAFSVLPRYELPVQQATLLMSAGLFGDAQRYLNIASDTPPLNKLSLFEKRISVSRTQEALNWMVENNGVDTNM